MYDYMAFLFVGVVVLGIGMLLGSALSAHDTHDEHPIGQGTGHDAIEENHTALAQQSSHGSVDDSQYDNSQDIATLKQEFLAYRQKVKQHLSDTENAIDTLTNGYKSTINRVLDSKESTPKRELVNELTQSYQNVFTKLSESARVLVDEPETRQRLDARRDKAVLINTQQRLKQSLPKAS